MEEEGGRGRKRSTQVARDITHIYTYIYTQSIIYHVLRTQTNSILSLSVEFIIYIRGVSRKRKGGSYLR